MGNNEYFDNGWRDFMSDWAARSAQMAALNQDMETDPDMSGESIDYRISEIGRWFGLRGFIDGGAAIKTSVNSDEIREWPKV